jgi:hypothetical protein
VQGSVRWSDGATERWSSAIGARASSGWLGTIVERESEQREKESKEEAWLGVARDSEKESRQLRERESRD